MEDILKSLKDENEKFIKFNSKFEASKNKFISLQTLENDLIGKCYLYFINFIYNNIDNLFFLTYNRNRNCF